MYLPPLPLLLLLLRLLRPLSPSDRALTPPGPDSQLAVEWSSHHLNRQPFAANSICTRTAFARSREKCRIAIGWLLFEPLFVPQRHDRIDAHRPPGREITCNQRDDP